MLTDTAMDVWTQSFLIAIGFYAVVGIVDLVYRHLKRRERAAAKREEPSDVPTSLPVVKKNTNTHINMKNSFVAIDFEHLYPSHETACEVGAVRVVDGLVTGRFHSTICPPEEMCTGRDNSDIIGLTADMLTRSPRFP